MKTEIWTKKKNFQNRVTEIGALGTKFELKMSKKLKSQRMKWKKKNSDWKMNEKNYTKILHNKIDKCWKDNNRLLKFIRHFSSQLAKCLWN